MNSKTKPEIFKQYRRKFSSEFKSKVALEAISDRYSMNELAEKFDLNRNQISEWRNKLITNAHLLFNSDERENLEVNETKN
jgi:transposase-like protein